MARYEEIWQIWKDMRRYEKIWGGMIRYEEICGQSYGDQHEPIWWDKRSGRHRWKTTWVIMASKYYLGHHGRHVLREAGALLAHPRHVGRLTWKCNPTSARKYNETFVPTNPLLQLSQIHFQRFSQSQVPGGCFTRSYPCCPCCWTSCPRQIVYPCFRRRVANEQTISSEIRLSPILSRYLSFCDRGMTHNSRNLG